MLSVIFYSEDFLYTCLCLCFYEPISKHDYALVEAECDDVESDIESESVSNDSIFKHQIQFLKKSIIMMIFRT